MKVSATVQSHGRGANNWPVALYLTGSPGAWEWTAESAAAFWFPDYLDSACKAGIACTEHADCVAATFGGWPVVRSAKGVDPTAPAKLAPAPSDPTNKIGERIQAARHRGRQAKANREARAEVPPETVFEELERRKQA